MAKRILFDSNIIIYYLNGAVAVESYFECIKNGEIVPVISIITKIEILSYPSIKEQEIAAVEMVLNKFEIIPLTEPVVLNTIRIKREYSIKLPDAVIAATAISEHITILTRDATGFRKIKGLTIENPFL